MIISIIGLLLVFPLLLVLSVFIYMQTKKNPFFFQRRPGLEGKIFTMIKLRTMIDTYDSEGELLPDVDRIPAWGLFLREISLDEIPQLINVLKGDMSLVGPRPLLPAYLSLYSAFHRQRHRVRPGITGWAQINGRNAISWQQKFDLDVWYVKHYNFKLDMKIIGRTFQRVCSKKNINYSEWTTMPEFNGTN